MPSFFAQYHNVTGNWLMMKITHPLVNLFIKHIWQIWAQVEDPAMRWQMSLYKERSGKDEDAEDPEKVVKRVQEVSAVLYHIEVVSNHTSSGALPANICLQNWGEKLFFTKGLFISWFYTSDRASLQVKENGLAQAAVQAAPQGSGGLFQNDTTVQHPQVRIQWIFHEKLPTVT